jgi:hypothetical protein
MGITILPVDIKPALAYVTLCVIVGGVHTTGVTLACVKEGKVVDINMGALCAPV